MARLRKPLGRWHVNSSLNEMRDPVMKTSEGRTSQGESTANSKILRQNIHDKVKVQQGDQQSKYWESGKR